MSDQQQSAAVQASIDLNQARQRIRDEREIRARWEVSIDISYTNTGTPIGAVYIPNVAAQAAVLQAMKDIPRLLKIIDEMREAPPPMVCGCGARSEESHDVGCFRNPNVR